MGAIFFLLIVAGLFTFGWKIAAKYGPGIQRRQRDRQIETAMRYGMYDAEAQMRVAQKLIDERNE